jgi:amino acid transporter
VVSRIRHLIIGSPLPTEEVAHRRLNKIRALAAFSPDALSSVAYANEEIFLALVVAGSAGLLLSLPIALAIAGLLILVALSYYQTIQRYPTGGGSYAVARENLGAGAGLIAGSALLLDYVLTAAVSLTAGVAAIASAFPILWDYRVGLSLLLLVIITLLNLRGIRETGTWMSIPVYLFIVAYLVMIAIGTGRVIAQGPGSLVAVAPQAIHPLTALLILRAFSVGCTALTGIETMSNGVPAFKPPESRNAGRTLMVMAALMGLLFVGSMGLTQYLAVLPGPQETITSALARRLLGSGPAYFVIQGSTMLILAVAANSSFAGFPRVASIMARDGYLPRQLASLGDRLVFNNGILLLSVVTGALIVLFKGDTHALVPLFALGAFLAFTLSQMGMVAMWIRDRGRAWRLKAFLNGVGGLATGVTVIVVGVTKFLAGAWITILLIPIIVLALLKMRSHYEAIAEELSLSGSPPSLAVPPRPRVVIPIAGVHRGIVDAIAFARSISDDVTAVHVELEPGSGQRMLERWERWWPDVPLIIVPSPYRSIVGPLLDFLDETDAQHDDGQLATVILPEFVPAAWWQNALHAQTAWLIRTALLYRRRHLGYQRTIIDVPFHLGR